MEGEWFRFKQFAVRHSRSSMKVGVDAVLLGVWAGKEPKKILDVGTGCGVISLILAQRFPSAQIMGIDIDLPSIEEAMFNFNNSIWKNSLTVRHAKFPDDLNNDKFKFDLIVSNPPFFKSGIVHPTTRREKARHQDSLSVFTLIEHSQELLVNNGVLAMIYPFEFHREVIYKAKEMGLEFFRECLIRGNIHRPVKRVMAEFRLNANKYEPVKKEELTLYDDGNEPTEEYRNLCINLYLKF